MLTLWILIIYALGVILTYGWLDQGSIIGHDWLQSEAAFLWPLLALAFVFEKVIGL